jgi:hypothetical protein
MSGGFDAAWQAYLCAMYGHSLSYWATATSGPRLIPARCTRCGATIPDSIYGKRDGGNER